MRNKFNKLINFNKTLKPPKELGGVFLPKGSREQFDLIFVAEMPSMNEPKGDDKKNFNFGVTARDRFFQEIMIKYNVAGSYVTDIVKQRDVPRQPSKAEIIKWRSFLLEEIKIIQPRAIIVIGKRTYEDSFKPHIEPFISKEIRVDYVYHYSSQVKRIKFEQRFSEVISRIKNSE